MLQAVGEALIQGSVVETALAIRIFEKTDATGKPNNIRTVELCVCVWGGVGVWWRVVRVRSYCRIWITLHWLLPCCLALGVF